MYLFSFFFLLQSVLHSFVFSSLFNDNLSVIYISMYYDFFGETAICKLDFCILCYSWFILVPIDYKLIC